ncbi:TRAP transporter large permease [Streptomyces sp. NPDC020792]|uniref:TRAP transporter large permease n=1 Tax=Streptomyces sp. NPDC020792 TaxID=3365089 RepID=UPI0037BB7E7A
MSQQVEPAPAEPAAAKDVDLAADGGWSGKGGSTWVWRLSFYGLFAVTLWLTIGFEATEMVGVGTTLMFLVLLFMKVPVAVSLIVPSLIGMTKLYGWTVAAPLMLGETVYEESASWSLSVVPMFIFMGIILWRAGVTARLYDAMNVMFRRVPASLAVGTNVAGGGLAAVSGSTMGTTYALARIGIPEMLKSGYDRRIATASVLFAGLSGQLIPPSILLVVFAGIASIPIGPTLMAGVLPGILLVVITSAVLIGIGLVKPSLVGGRTADRTDAASQLSRRRKVQVVLGCWPVPVLVATVLGGIFSGLLTETEAGAVGAFVSVLLSLWFKRRDSLKEIWNSMVETASATASIFFMLIGATMLTLVVGDSGAADGVATWVIDSDLSRVGFLALLFLVYLIAGMFGESLVAMLLTVPVLMPLLPELGIDPLFFGVFIVLCVELGMILPPTGVLTYVVHAIAKDPEVRGDQEISLRDIFTGVVWLLPIPVLLIVVMTFFPDLVTLIPNHM